MDSDAQWAEGARQFQQLWGDSWNKLLQSMPPADLGAMTASMQPHTPFSVSPEKLAEIQQNFVKEMQALISSSVQETVKPLTDRRFTGDGWAQNPVASGIASAYMLQAKTLMGMAEAVEADEKTKARIRFGVEQWLAAMSPSNFLAFNAEAQKKTIETQGESIAKGVANMLHDMRQGHISMTDESKFEVGRNVATTEGAVVFENEYFQLNEYNPLTATVYERPFLLVPPCINKFYILDLQPENSLIRYLVAEGHRTFVVSWRNPDETMAQATWDDYIENAVIKAIDTAQQISGADQINTLGFCVGGTMLVNALGVLSARKESPVASATLLTALVDFTETGILDVFIDENFVRFREMQMGQGGLMKGQDLASTFSFLRPNDLVWNYVVGNYLKGEVPPAFDLLYWNSDSTNLPGPWYAWYLRNFYLDNKLPKPGGVTVCGEKLDLTKVDLPMFIYGSREDHIVPIQGAYASTQIFPGKKRFVMGASGHIAGVINPPAKKKRSYWVQEQSKFPASFDAWLASATEHPGSWWTDWSEWLSSHAGKQITAPKTYGKGTKYKASEPAPGSYVKQKS